VWRLVSRADWRASLSVAAVVGVVVGWWVADPLGWGIGPFAGDYGRALGAILSGLDSPSALADRLAMSGVQVFENEAPEAFFGLEIAPGLNTILVLVALTGVAMNLPRLPAAGLMVFGLFGLLLLLGYPVRRYFLMVQPFMLLGWLVVFAAASARCTPKRRDHLLAFALLMVLVPNVGMCARHIWRQRALPFYEHYDHGKWVEAIAASEAARARLPESAVILAPEARVVTYLSGRTAVNCRQRPKGLEGEDWVAILKRLGVTHAVLPAGLYRKDPDARGLIDRGAFVSGEPIAGSPDGGWVLVPVTFRAPGGAP